MVSSPIAIVIVAVVLFVISRPIIHRVASAEAKPWLIRIMTISLILHLLAAPAQVYVVNHFYGGVADFLRYDNKGAILAPGFRHLHFSIASANVGGIVNNGSVSIAAGIVFAIVGINQIAGFLVFSWLAFLGTILFFRAFSLTFAGADQRRYAYLLFLFPSLIFWTADISKESIMMLSLGVTSYGAAKVLARKRGGFLLVLLGVAIGILIRPNELLVAMGGFTVAMLVGQSGVQRTASGAGRRFLRITFFGSLLGLSIYLTLHYLHSSGGSFSLQQTAHDNNGPGAGFGSSGVPYSTSLATYPRDIYYVLFDPLPVTAHSTSQFIAALENSFIVAVILLSLRQIRMVPRAAIARGYVMMCVVYSLGFMYAIAALGNLGLITRERTMLFPFLLVPLCIPLSPRGQRPRYEWELRRRDRLRLRHAAQMRRRSPGYGASPPDKRLNTG
jgi:hypothetical protein